MNRVSLLSCALLTLFLTGCNQSDTATTKEIYAMDTVMQLTAYGASAQNALDEAESQLLALENAISRTRPTSQVSAINTGTGAVEADDVVVELLRSALDYSHATNGAFECTIAPVVDIWGFTTDDPSVPSAEDLSIAMGFVGSEFVTITDNSICVEPGSAIDLGGIAKGYAAQVVADVFQQQGISNAMVSLGGNVYVCGGRTDGDPWRIGVQDPNNLSGFAGVLSLSDGFAVTSGAYQRYFEEDGVTYHHIIDPQTGYPAQSGLISVTIVSTTDGTLCDALSTALYVMGEADAIDFWRSGVYDFDMILVTDDGRVVVSSGIADQFEADGAYTYEVIS